MDQQNYDVDAALPIARHCEQEHHADYGDGAQKRQEIYAAYQLCARWGHDDAGVFQEVVFVC